MLDSLFGAEMPLAVRFFLAFLIVLGLIGATAWAVRRFGTGRLGASRAGRQPRLAVIDYASVDGRRRLILVRRDNVEHLMMIGGPTDVVVETNIVRAQAAPRELARPTAGIDALARAIPLPETANGGSWPLAPEPTPPVRPRAEALPDELPRPPHAEPPARPQRDTLTALADELAAPRPTPPSPPSPPSPPRRPTPPRPAAAEEPKAKSERKAPTPPAAPAAPPAAAPSPAAAPAEADQSLADMAQRLEAALRKPEARPAAPAPRAEHAAEPPRPPRPSEAKPARPEGKPNKSTLYDNLEQEMASLLGRPTKP